MKFLFRCSVCSVIGLLGLIGAVNLSFAVQETAQPDFLPMLQRNCAPNGYDASPELYLIYFPDVLTSSTQGTEFACSHGFPWEEDSRIPLILYGYGIKNGVRIADAASLEDITSTLAFLMDQDPPETANGRVLEEALLTRHRSCRGSRGKGSHGKGPGPRATLVFTLDQCRADYFTNPQIAPALVFARNVLMKHGASYSHARLSYAGSRTAVSHATIGTGATPGIHGIVGNNIRVGDAFPLALNGTPRHSMEMFNLLTPTLADVVDLALDNRPIIISMSPYGRAALGMGGHGAAFSSNSDKDILIKLSRDTGLPYTNTEYFQLPESLINSDHNPIRIDHWLADNYGVDIHAGLWTQETVIVDNSPYALKHHNVIIGPQGKFPDGTPFTFSYAMVTEDQTPPVTTQQVWDGTYPSNSYYEEAMYTPYYTLWATDMLLRTMAHEGFGRDPITDLLYYNFKCLDKLGHRYGVNSPEVYTYLYTVDYCLKKIKHFMDKSVGKAGYTMVVTADHGAHNAYNERILYSYELFNAIESRFGQDVILNDPNNDDPFDDMIYLDRERLGDQTIEDVSDFIKQKFGDVVYRAYTLDEIFQ